MRAATSISHEPLIALVKTLHQSHRISDQMHANAVHAKEADRLWYLHDAFAAAASAGPLLLQVDDLHHADRKSLEALHYCIGRLQDLPIRWQLATRPGSAGVSEMLLSLERAGLLSVIELDGLEPDALRLLAGSLRPEIAFDSEKVIELHCLTGGNPLYAELLLTANTWDLSAPPGDLRRSLEQRFSGLSQDARNVAGWLAVEGAPLSESTLTKLGNLSAAQLHAALSELADNRILSFAENGAFFRHDLLRGACYNLLRERERVARHTELAKQSKDLWQQANHLEGAHQLARAAALFNRLGWQGLERHAPSEALGAFRRVLARAKTEASAAIEARGGTAAALFRLGMIAEAKAAMSWFETHASQVCAETRVLVRRSYVEAAWDESDDFEHIRPVLDLALGEARSLKTTDLPGLLCVLGSIFERQGELQLARDTLQEGLQSCDSKQQREKIRLTAWLGVATVRCGDVAGGIALLERAANECAAAGLGNELAQCSTKLCYVYHMAGDLEKFSQWCRIGLEVTGPKSKTTEALLKSYLASVAVDHGDLQEALGLALSAETYIAGANVTLRCRVLTLQAQVYAMLGDFEIAETVLRKCALLDLPSTSRRLADFTSGFVAELREYDSEAMRWFEAAISGLAVTQIRERYEMRALAGIVRTSCALKQLDKAMDALAKLEQVVRTGWASAEPSLHEARGHVALLRGDRAAAVTELLSASTNQYAFWRAHIELLAAVAGQDRRLFLDAIEQFDSMGASYASDCARALARSHGFRPGRKRESHGALSARETSVAFFVANGKTNAEIGELLHVSSRTVEYHIGNILSKCGLRSRVDIAAKIAAGESLESAG